jgi:hypothetical protein
MPKTALFTLLGVALALAACSGGDHTSSLLPSHAAALSSTDLIKDGYATYACDPKTGNGCTALVYTSAGQARFAVSHPVVQLNRPDLTPMTCIKIRGELRCSTPAPGPTPSWPATPAPTPLPTVPPGSTPLGLQPSDLQKAYHDPLYANDGQPIIAVIEGAHDPTLEHDLDIYREEFGLPTCDMAVGCLVVWDQNGGTSYPSATVDWQEESEDVDVVSAMCPNCAIMVIEADLPNAQQNPTLFMTNLTAAVNTAVSYHAFAITISYSMDERPITQAQYTAWASSYAPTNIPIVASAGDSGFNDGLSQGGNMSNQIPADFPTVVSVGGTTLTPDSGASRGYDEVVWNTGGGLAGGSGCSLYAKAPSFQTTNFCPGMMREIPDLSFSAAPYAVFGTDPNTNVGTWMTLGGTSEGAPAIAALYAEAAHIAGIPPPLSELYTMASSSSNVFDITSGNNLTTFGGTCSPTQLCNAGAGFDGATGVGTPNGASVLGWPGGLYP